MPEPISPDQITPILASTGDTARFATDPDSSAASENPQFSVVFADLVGSTALSDRLDAEDVRLFLNELMQEMCDAIYQMRGSVEKFLGDGVVGLFRAAEGARSDAERAVRTALLMRQRMELLSGRWQERFGQAMQLHIGIDTGSSPGEDTFTIASLLQDTATGGEILVGPLVRQQTDHLCVYHALSPIRVGSSGQTSHPYRLVDVRPDEAGAFERLSEVESLPFPDRRSVQTADAPLSPGERRRSRSSLPARSAEDERRQVTVLFADISHITASEDDVDPEAYRSFLNELMRLLGDVVYQYEGTVQRFFGNAIMALFGAPITHEDDPERAVRAALGMLQTVKDLNATWAEKLHREMTLQIGVDSGTVVAGEIELGSDATYAVTGDTMNTAARLRSVASPGQILVGPDTYRLTGRLCDYETLPPMTLKGKPRPVQVYALRGLFAEPRAARGLESRGISSPLVGRDEELGVFLGALEEVVAGTGGVLALWGDAGVGKSRLVAEACARAEGMNLVWLEGRTLSYTRNLSYWPFLEILKGWSGINEDDLDPAALAKLQRRLETLAPEAAAESLPYLASIMALDLDEELTERVRYLDGDGMRRQIFRAMRRCLESLARQRPLVLFFEDLHWMDESSIELLEHLLPMCREVPVLFCGAGRPDSEASSGRLLRLLHEEYAGSLKEIHLTPLTPGCSAQLLHNLLAVDSLPTEFRTLILDRAEGNPFFVEEVIRTLIDTEAVVRDRRTGRWKATDRVQQTVIPETIQGVIMARVDRLPDAVKQILRLACVVGRSFFYRVLTSIAENDAALDQGLKELQNLELIREKHRMPELEYIFKHALVQDATYNNMLRQRRQDLHRRVADSIETLFPDRLDEFCGLIAYHAARAEDWERAQKYLFKAADQAGKIAADSEALAQYQQAMAAYAKVFGDRWDPFQRAVLERKIGEALFRRVEMERAREGFCRALEYLGTPFPSTPRDMKAETVKQLLRQMGHRRLPGLFLKPGRNCEDPVACERATIYHNLCWIDFWLDIQRLPLDCFLLLNEAERAGEQVCTVRGHQVLGLICSYIPLRGQAEHHHQRAVELAQEIEQPVAIGQAFLGMGMHRYAQGNWDEAAHAMARSRDAYWQAGDLRGWGAPMNYITWIKLLRGEVGAAALPAEQLAQVGEDGGDRQLQGWGVGYRGSVLMRGGRPEEAIPFLKESGTLARSISDHVSASMADADLGRCYLRLGRIDLALEALEATNRTLDDLKTVTGGCTAARAALAEAYLAAVDGAAGQERAALLKKAWCACAATLKLARIHHEGLLSGCRVRGALEWIRGRPHTARAWWRKGIAACEKVGARPDLALTHLEIGRRTGSEPDLQRGQELLRQT